MTYVVDDRFAKLEDSLVDLKSALQDISNKLSNPTPGQTTDSSSSTPPVNPAASTIPTPTTNTPVASNLYHSEDVQATFASIKASVLNVRLPAELTLASSGTIFSLFFLPQSFL